jgi:hypothetical protein
VCVCVCQRVRSNHFNKKYDNLNCANIHLIGVKKSKCVTATLGELGNKNLYFQAQILSRNSKWSHSSVSATIWCTWCHSDRTCASLCVQITAEGVAARCLVAMPKEASFPFVIRGIFYITRRIPHLDGAVGPRYGAWVLILMQKRSGGSQWPAIKNEHGYAFKMCAHIHAPKCVSECVSYPAILLMEVRTCILVHT